MITLTGFGKDYGDFTAVDSIDLQIDAGETFGFIGPNGAGKSTTIRFLATPVAGIARQRGGGELRRDGRPGWRAPSHWLHAG